MLKQKVNLNAGLAMGASSNWDSYKQRISLADISCLHGYELLSESEINNIVSSFNEDVVLQHPIVCDVARCLVIDGQHRLEALKRVGVNIAPAFAVDYLSDEVAVQSWQHRVLDSDAIAIEQVIRDILRVSPLPNQVADWAVMLNANGYQQTWGFKDSFAAAETLQFIIRSLGQKGYRIQRIVPPKPGKPSRMQQPDCSLSICPIVGKKEVLEMVASGKRYPPQVNRHIIHRRALNINCPMNILTLPIDLAARQFDLHLQICQPVSVGPGSIIDGRHYEEEVVNLTPDDWRHRASAVGY